MNLSIKLIPSQEMMRVLEDQDLKPDAILLYENPAHESTLQLWKECVALTATKLGPFWVHVETLAITRHATGLQVQARLGGSSKQFFDTLNLMLQERARVGFESREYESFLKRANEATYSLVWNIEKIEGFKNLELNETILGGFDSPLLFDSLSLETDSDLFIYSL